jgi:hypothetical protein
MLATALRPLSVSAGLILALAPAAFAQFGDGWETDFSKHTVPLDEIVSGGPPKDGIPAIDRPSLVSVAEADRWLEDREPVAVIAVGGEARAYPLQILIWHEIVNDEVGGLPVSVTYCPLCNTTLAFDRRFDGRVLDFGTTGRLRHSDLVMYDRQTETWWQQATGEGIVGRYAGEQLTFVSAPLVSWETFKESHPEGRVLSRETGFDRPYGENPYQRYDRPSGSPWKRFFRPDPDDRLPAMERVVALTLGNATVAYPFSALEEKRVINHDVANTELVVLWTPGMASSVDSRNIAEGRDVGSSGVFSRRVGSRVLSFEPAGDALFRDRETGTTWNILGEAVRGELKGTRLEPIPHGNHFWFAWAAFKPDTEIVRD